MKEKQKSQNANLKDKIEEKKGQATLEYGLMIAVVTTAILTALTEMKEAIGTRTMEIITHIAGG